MTLRNLKHIYQKATTPNNLATQIATLLNSNEEEIQTFLEQDLED
jgi:hypothetical protein